MGKVSEKVQKLRNARLGAVQGLYMLELTDFSVSEILNGFINGTLGKEVLDDEGEIEEFVRISPPDAELLGLIMRKYDENGEYVDEVISKSLDAKWTADRLELVLRSILRAGVTEMLYRSEADVAMLIDEYVGLTDSFYGEAEPGLVHAVLHKVGAIR